MKSYRWNRGSDSFLGSSHLARVDGWLLRNHIADPFLPAIMAPYFTATVSVQRDAKRRSDNSVKGINSDSASMRTDSPVSGGVVLESTDANP